MKIKEAVEQGKTVLGLELGSTRIKAVLIDESHQPIAMGSYEWENQLKEGIWTYDLEEAFKGIRQCYLELKQQVKDKYQVILKRVSAMGISGMMHGYLPFDQKGNQLTEFRTWRNTMTLEASQELSTLFSFQIPQRWSIAHLYQAMLNREDHVKDIAYLTTLAGYIHWKLTGQQVMGIGEASGMFPVDTKKKDYEERMIQSFEQLEKKKGYSWKLRDILPKVLVAGEDAGYLTKEGALFLDPEGDLEEGIPFCPPEGDAGTGMVATNAVEVGTGNVSAGTSIFAMVVLAGELSRVHEELDIVTTPAGDNVAMVHCNNGTSDLNAWVGLFEEFTKELGVSLTKDDFYVYTVTSDTGVTEFRFVLKSDAENGDDWVEASKFSENGKYTESEQKDGCKLTFDSAGRITAISVPTAYDADGNIIAYQDIKLTAETVTDNAAYEDAYNQYQYAQYEYDRMQQEINAKTEIIQQQDRNLELKLQRLDNERTQITTEIEAVEKVINDNIESSYKTFSG